MKVIATNIAKPVSFEWEGEMVTTGIFKKPVGTPLFLTKDDVATDEISDRLSHGGYYKACYIFSADYYDYWKKEYPCLEWDWGMFGENLTVQGFSEKEMYVGSIYKLGSTILQVSQYREPCYKLGYRFGDQRVIKKFVQHGCAGTYFSVLKEGDVHVGDKFELVEAAENSMTVSELFALRHYKPRNQELLKIASVCPFISHKERAIFKKFLEE